MPIIHYHDYTPIIDKTCFIAPSADVIGNVRIGAGSSIWFGCVIRGDVESITIGKRTNIQDGTTVHVTRNGGPTWIGSNVTIGHKALIHACTLEDACFVGMGAIIMDKAVIETGGMLAAGAMLTPGKRIKKGELWAGVPAKFWRNLTQEEADYIAISAENYYQHALEYPPLLRDQGFF